MDCSTTETNSLGVTITKVGDKLERNLYCKPTDTHRYLHAQSSHRNLYQGSIAYGQVVRFKRICSIEGKLYHSEQLKQWFKKRGSREDHAYSRVERIKLVEKTVSFQIRGKKVDDSIKLNLTYHPALNELHEILRRAHKHVLEPPRLQSALLSPPKVAFRNSKTRET